MSQKQCKGLIAVTAGNLHNGTVCAIHLRWPFVIMLITCISKCTAKKISGIFPARGCSCLHHVALLCSASENCS